MAEEKTRDSEWDHSEIGLSDGWVNGWMDGWMDEWMDGQMDE